MGGKIRNPSLATALLLQVHCLQTSTGSKPAGGLQPCSFHSFHRELCISLFQSALKHSLPHLYCLAVATSVAYTRNQLKWSLSLCQFSLKSIETIVTCEIYISGCKNLSHLFLILLSMNTTKYPTCSPIQTCFLSNSLHSTV